MRYSSDKVVDLCERLQASMDNYYETLDKYDEIELQRKYLKAGESAPKGRVVKTTAAGKRYYETKPRTAAKASSKFKEGKFYGKSGEELKDFLRPKNLTVYGNHAVSSDDRGNLDIWARKRHAGGHHFEHITGEMNHYPGPSLSKLFDDTEGRNYEMRNVGREHEDFPESQHPGEKSSFYDEKGNEIDIPHVVGSRTHMGGNYFDDEEDEGGDEWSENPIHVMHKDEKGNLHLFFNDDEFFHRGHIFTPDAAQDVRAAIHNHRVSGHRFR